VKRRRDYRRVSRGLRFRLTTSYAVLFTILLTLVALLFRERLHSALDQQIEEELNQEWAAMKGYMRIEPNQEKGGKINASWYYDPEDPDAAEDPEDSDDRGRGPRYGSAAVPAR
jgi:hypothetical protein